MPDDVVTPEPTDVRFTAADIERARQQEKDKLYPKVEQLTTQSQELANQNKTMLEELAALTKEREDRQALEEKNRQKAEAEVLKAQQAKMSAEELIAAKSQEWDAKVNEVNNSWEQKFEKIAREREQERAFAEKERQFSALASYIQRRQVELDTNAEVHPSLMDLITGDTEAEVEQSIAVLKAKTDDIVKDAVSAAQVARSQMPGVSTYGQSVTGPADNTTGQQTYSAQDINDMSMKDFAALRPKLGISSGGQGRGLFG